ncbi:MAG: hypothetical protein ACYTBW_03380 [Planctomycetota bacterium]|jgi:hypothetical protein
MKTHTHKMRSTITKADASAEEVMKCYTGEYTARRILFIFPILAILLTVSPMPAQAGVIDTVNNKVTTILKKVKSIASNTSGLQEFITTLRDIRDSMGGGMISDMRESIGDTQNLIQFVKDRRESAGQTSQYPSLPNLFRSLDGVADVLLERDGQGGALEGLAVMLAVLPDKALAPVARAVSKVGIDEDFVAKIDQMGVDLIEIRDILEETAARRSAASQVAGDYWITNNDLYQAEFGCHVHDSTRLVRLSRAARGVKKTAEILKLFGALTEATQDVVKFEKGLGVWGWVTFKVRVDIKESTSKILGVIADGALVLVDSAERIVDTCRDEFEVNEA